MSYCPQFRSRGQAPNITVLEDLAPGSTVVQVRARGFNVRYEIVSPVPCPLFSIGRGEGNWGWWWWCEMPLRLVQSDPRYLLALLRNEAGAEADGGEVAFGGPARIRGEPRASEEEATGARLSALQLRGIRWEDEDQMELGAWLNSAFPTPTPPRGRRGPHHRAPGVGAGPGRGGHQAAGEGLRAAQAVGRR